MARASGDPRSFRNVVADHIIGASLGLVATLVGGVLISLWQAGVIFPGAGHADVRKAVSLMERMSAPENCFTTERHNASLTFKNYGGRAEGETNKFIQCGTFHSPKLASGTYRFRYKRYPPGSRLIQVTAVAGIDEASHPSQTDTVATWIISYRGKEVCRTDASFLEPQEIECDVDVEETKADLSKLTIEQKVSPSAPHSDNGLWVGLLEPQAVVELPSDRS